MLGYLKTGTGGSSKPTEPPLDLPLANLNVDLFCLVFKKTIPGAMIK